MSYLFQAPGAYSDPYDSSSYSGSSEDEEDHDLLPQMDHSYGPTSQHQPNRHSATPSYITQQRQSFCTPRNKPTYTKSRRALNKLMKSQHDMEYIENELEEERKRGRFLLIACILMSIFCAFLFADRWPEDWRGALIELLQKGRERESTSNSQSAITTTNHDGKVKSKDPLGDFQKKEKDRLNVDIDDYVNDDDNHYSKYGDSYERYKETHKTKTHKKKDASEKPKKPTEKELIEENEKQHIDNLSKLLKWNLPYKDDRDVPLFWHIPLSGTKLIDEIFGRCYGLIQATDDGKIMAGHEDDGILKVITEGDKRYINVDLGTVNGISKAKELHLARSGTVELMRTSFLYEVAVLFQSTANYGKCFTMMRDPLERSIDVFYTLKETSKNIVFKSMTLEEYIKSPYVEDNWMVRVLSNEREDELKDEHLDLAKQILGRKCIVGFADDFEESIRRFVKYFHWEESKSKEEVEECKEELHVAKLVESGDFTEAPHNNKDELGDEVKAILREKNKFDLKLYEYARGLYNTQSLYSR